METYVVGVELIESRYAEVTKVHGKLVLHDLDSMLDALLAKGVGEHERTTETDSLDTESKQLDGIGAVADTTVGQDLNLVKQVGVLAEDLESDLKRRGAVVQLTTAVVGEDNSRNLVLNGELDVVDGLDTLQDDGEVGHGGQLLVPFPLRYISNRTRLVQSEYHTVMRVRAESLPAN
jgi:hypothetical protein